MGRSKLRTKVIKLRKKGKTYSEIQNELNVRIPKSTISTWCRKVILPYWYKKKIIKLNNKNSKKALSIAWAINKQKRENFLKKVRQEATIILRKFNRESYKIALAMLYLGEGAKWKSHSGLLLGSSDPLIILLYISLLEKCYKIKKNKLRCRISYRADQNIQELEAYWSNITGIPKENFYKTKPDPRTIGKRTKKSDYKGVCVVSCAGSHIQIELEEIARLISKKIRAHSLEEKR